MKDLHRRQTRVHFTHEPLEEDHLGQADRQRFQIARERVQIVEVVKLHSLREWDGGVVISGRGRG